LRFLDSLDVSADSKKASNQPHRTVIRSARFTPEEWKAVQDRAARAGLSPSRFLRSAALGVSLGRKANQEAVLAFNRVGVNLNNLIRLAARSGQTILAADAAELLALLRERLRDFL